VIAPLYRVRVDWGGATDLLRVGFGHVGGPETIFGGTADEMFTGLFDSAFADVTDEVTKGKIQRKVSSDGVVEGTLDLTLKDSWPGKYNAKNSASPLNGLIVPAVRTEVDVSFDSGATWQPIYGGWLSESEADPDYDQNQARLNFTDLAYLSRALDAIPPTGPTTVAAALGLVHDSIGWPADLRSFSSDTVLSDFSTDGTGTARDAVAAIIKVDLGYYYVSRDFAATYADRYEYARRASAATVQATGQTVPGVSIATVVNRASATGPSAVTQSYEDGHSKKLYGPLQDQQGDAQSDWFRDDAAALANAKWRVMTQKDPTSPYWQFEPVPADDATLEACVLLDALDVVTVEPVGLPADEQQAMWVLHDFGGGRAHRPSWRLREKPALSPFLVGSSLVGSSDVVVPG
jgi:hypothetical protein